jgi:hypothetical protein
LPLASRFKPLHISSLERQVLFLFAIPPVYRKANAKMKNQESTMYTNAVEKGPNQYLTMRNFTPKVNFTELG